MKELRQRLRLFACTKARTGGRACCAYQEAPIILDDCGGRFWYEERSAPTSMSDGVVVLIDAKTAPL